MSKDKAAPTVVWSVRLSAADYQAFDTLAAASLIGRPELLQRFIAERTRLRSYRATAALGHVIATLATIRRTGGDPAVVRLLEDQIKELSRLVTKELR